MVNTLPDKASDLIELALNDLAAAERDPSYAIDMARWHEPKESSTIARCSVCLAGAVMAFSLGVPLFEDLTPSDIGGHNHDKLIALNGFRVGDIESALLVLGVPAPARRQERRSIVEYADNPSLFKSQLRQLARDLRAEGL